MKTTVQRVTLSDRRRVLMLSDIHAHCDDFIAVLKKAAFSPDDVLIIAGDLIEKGTLSSMGFATKSFMPSERNISFTPLTAFAVSAMIGTLS